MRPLARLAIVLVAVTGTVATVTATVRKAFAQHDHIDIWSTEPGGGQLVLDWDFDTKKVQTHESFCAGVCLYSTIDLAFLAPTAAEDTEGDAFYPLVDGTRLEIHLVAVDDAMTLNVNGARLDEPGESALLGTTPNVHVHPSWQLVTEPTQVGDFPISYRVISDSPRYADSDIFENIVTNVAVVATPMPTPTATPTPALCPGDCGADGEVTVDEILAAVNIALGSGGECVAADTSRDGSITVDEIVSALTAALEGCPGGLPAVAFATLQQEIFDASCANALCHNSVDRVADLDLSDGAAYESLVGVAPSTASAVSAGFSRVDPGNPENSFLLVKIAGPRPEFGSRMPLDRPALPDTHIDAIRRWIRGGAHR